MARLLRPTHGLFSTDNVLRLHAAHKFNNNNKGKFKKRVKRSIGIHDSL